MWYQNISTAHKTEFLERYMDGIGVIGQDDGFVELVMLI
jgi:hypothetical protein